MAVYTDKEKETDLPVLLHVPLHRQLLVYRGIYSI